MGSNAGLGLRHKKTRDKERLSKSLSVTISSVNSLFVFCYIPSVKCIEEVHHTVSPSDIFVYKVIAEQCPYNNRDELVCLLYVNASNLLDTTLCRNDRASYLLSDNKRYS